MKRLLVVLFAVFCVTSAQAQWENGLGYFTEEEVRERDALNQQVKSQQNWQNDRYFDMIVKGGHNPQLYQKVNNAVNKAQNGVRIETSSYSQSGSSGKRVTNQQMQQIQRNKRDAEHRAWLEQRRAQQQQAAEQARIRKQMEEQRKKQMHYELGRNATLAATAEHHKNLNDKISYNVTEGYDRTMNYQPEGTQQLQSQYIPSSSNSTKDIVAMIPKNGSNPIRLSLTGNEKVKSTNYELEYQKQLARSLKEMESIELKRYEPFKEEKQWDEMQKQLSASHVSALNYFLNTENGNSKLITINPDGKYVFGNEDETKIFVVSPDGKTMQLYSFEEHYWDDDNMIQKIRQDGLGQFFNDSFEIGGGKVDYKDLKDMSQEDLKKILPQIKAKIVIAADNSSLSYQLYVFEPHNYEPHNIPLKVASLFTDGYVNNTDVIEGKVTLSAGSKVEMKGEAAIAHLQGSMKFSVLEFNGHVSRGNVVSLGDKSYMFKIKADGKIGAGVSEKASARLKSNSGMEARISFDGTAFPGIYAGGGIKIEAKNITMGKKRTEVENVPTDKKSHSSGGGKGGGRRGGR